MSKKKEITKKAGSSGSTGESSPLLKKFIIVAGVTVIGTVVCMGLRSGMTETVYPAKDASKYFYIQDYSGVFSEKAEKYIFDEAVKLNKATTAQIVVMAVPDTDSESLEQYSLRTANNLGIGSKEKDNGILILFTTTSPHVRMEVGKGLEGTIPDARAGRILDDYAVEPKNKRHWNEAAMNTFTATAEILYQDSNIKAPESLQLVKDIDETEPGKTFADMTLPEGKPVTEGEDFTTQLAFLSTSGICSPAVAVPIPEAPIQAAVHTPDTATVAADTVPEATAAVAAASAEAEPAVRRASECREGAGRCPEVF